MFSSRNVILAGFLFSTFFLATLMSAPTRCKKKCNNLVSENNESYSPGGNTTCYTFSMDYGDVMYAPAPIGGKPVDQSIMIDKTMYSSCSDICAGPPAGSQITSRGTEGATSEVNQFYCEPSP